MQETGNNTITGRVAEKALTIRIAADGISFLCQFDKDAVPSGFFETPYPGMVADTVSKLIEAGSLIPDAFQKMEVEVDTNRIVLVPNTVFEDGMEQGYLKTNNIVCGQDEMVVVSPSFGIRAIMPVRRDAVEYLQSVWPELTFSSPILKSIYRTQRGTVELNLTQKVAYLTIIEDKLNYAEAFPYASTADLLYYMHLLGKNFDLQNSTTLVLGHNAEEVIKLLARYYKSVIGYAHYQW